MDLGPTRTLADGIRFTFFDLFLFFVLSALISPSYAVVSVTTAVICFLFMAGNDDENGSDLLGRDGSDLLGRGRISLVYLCLGLAVLYSQYCLIPMCILIQLPAIGETVKKRRFSSQFLLRTIVTIILLLQWGVMVSALSLRWPWFIAGAGGCIVVLLLGVRLGQLAEKIHQAREDERRRKTQAERERQRRAWAEQCQKAQEEKEQKRQAEKAREEEQRRQREAEAERVFRELLASPEGRIKLAHGLIRLGISPTTIDEERVKRDLLAMPEGREVLVNAFRNAEGNVESMAYLTKLWRKRSAETMRLCLAKAQDVVLRGQDPFDYRHFRGIRNY